MIKSVTRNGRSIVLTAVLALILVYLFSIVGFIFFKDDFIFAVDRIPNQTLGKSTYIYAVSLLSIFLIVSVTFLIVFFCFFLLLVLVEKNKESAWWGNSSLVELIKQASTTILKLWWTVSWICIMCMCVYTHLFCNSKIDFKCCWLLVLKSTCSMYRIWVGLGPVTNVCRGG